MGNTNRHVLDVVVCLFVSLFLWGWGHQGWGVDLGELVNVIREQDLKFPNNQQEYYIGSQNLETT